MRIAIPVGLLLLALIARADDDSGEWNFRTGRWDDDDDSHEVFFGRHRTTNFRSHNNHNWNNNRRTNNVGSWRGRYDDSGESRESFSHHRSWARPADVTHQVHRTSINNRPSSFGRPLQTHNPWARNTWAPKNTGTSWGNWNNRGSNRALQSNNVRSFGNQNQVWSKNQNKWSNQGWNTNRNRNNVWNNNRQRNFNTGQWNKRTQSNRRW